MSKLVTISLPNDLIEVWQALDKKSEWVQNQLRLISGREEEPMHIKFQWNQYMCNPFMKAICKICMEDFDSVEEYKQEWIKRTNWIRDNENDQNFIDYMNKRFVDGKKPIFQWHIDAGVKAE